MSTDKAARLQRAGGRGGRQAGSGRRRGGRVSLRAVGALIDELLTLLRGAVALLLHFACEPRAPLPPLRNHWSISLDASSDTVAATCDEVEELSR